MSKKMRPPVQPRKLSAADYEWEKNAGRYECFSWYWWDEGAMSYWGRWSKGRFVVTFEGTRVNDYQSPLTASKALAVMENNLRWAMYQERVQKWSEGRTRRELKKGGRRA